VASQYSSANPISSSCALTRPSLPLPVTGRATGSGPVIGVIGRPVRSRLG
jgi:hypothetical protein